MTGLVAWFTGLPASGKSTLAAAVAGDLRLRGIQAVTLDSDEVRAKVLPTLGYDDAGRTAFYTALAQLAALIARQGHIVLVAATAHRRAFRDVARQLAPSYIEIFVDTPLEECKQRDRKGVYAQPHAPVDYEAPLTPDVHATMGEPVAAPTIASMLASRHETR